MPELKGPRKKKAQQPAPGPVRPPAVEDLLRELDGLLERLAEEGTKCADLQDCRSVSRDGLLAVRWLVTRRLLDLEFAADGTRLLPADTPARIEDSWIKAAIEADTPKGSFSSAPKTHAHDPLAHIAEEIATYRARLPEMLTEHEGEFVLIKGSEIVGFFADDSSALRDGNRRFGRFPFLVKEVIFPERVIYLPNVVL
jgi:hypothetical protein